MRVTFFLDEDGLDHLRRLDPDEHWRELQVGERAWGLQTYLRLARAGYPAELSRVAPDTGVIFFHAKQGRTLARRLPRRRDVVLVGARADNREPLAADIEVVQNGRFADGRRRFFLPLWPQPGLVPRDPARGATLARLVYKGFDRNLHPAFRSATWSRFLAAQGIEWVTDSVAFAGLETDKLAVEWPDFRQVDAILAVRPDERNQRNSKPATKLLNAWLAGVPALLGPEYAYRELRRSELDYLEVGSPEEAEAAVRRLQSDPGLYRAMVENGRARAAEYTIEALVARWAELFYETIPALARTPASRWSRRVPLPLKVPARALARLLTLRPAR